jgi:hypothetical protein
MTCPSAVTIIEAPDCFVVEDRPNSPGQLAYAGKLQLFGGHANPPEEDPLHIITRELDEEIIGLSLEAPPLLVWSGDTPSQNRDGQPVTRFTSLFYVATASAVQLTLNVRNTQGKIVRIPKTLVDIGAHEDRLTPFAFNALSGVVQYKANGGVVPAAASEVSLPDFIAAY